MRTFRSLLEGKMADEDFSRLFDRECHVCGNTVRIFAELTRRGISLEKAAGDLGADLESLCDLETADYCDPHLVVRLCRYLGLTPPADCPRRTGPG